jgi:hypothetical protein
MWEMKHPLVWEKVGRPVVGLAGSCPLCSTVQREMARTSREPPSSTRQAEEAPVSLALATSFIPPGMAEPLSVFLGLRINWRAGESPLRSLA